MQDRSRCFEQTAQQAAHDYLRDMKRGQALMAGSVLLLVLAALALVLFLKSTAGYFVCLFAAVGAIVAFRAYQSRRFEGLMGILTMDCDAEKCREAVERVVQADTHKRVQALYVEALALADYHANKPGEALELLTFLSYRPGKSTLEIREHALAALCHDALGDADRRNASIAKLESIAARCRKGSSKRKLVDGLVEDLKMLTCSPRRLDAQGLERLHAKAEGAKTRLEWVAWRLVEARCQAFRGNLDAARSVLAELERGPLTSRMQGIANAVRRKYQA